jgi:PAS domain-containing protein
VTPRVIRIAGAVRRRALAACLALALVPASARADGPWSTWIKMVTTHDILALRDTVWMATGEAGIVRYLRSAQRFEQVTREPGGLASNDLTSLAFDRSGRLWAGTQGKGVSRLSALGGWDLVNAFDGLPSDSVTVLRADGDTVWIGTTRGIALWNGHQVAGSIPDLGTASPFRDNGISGIVVAGDSLFVGTGDGVFLARPSQDLTPWTEVSTGLSNLAVTGMALWHHRPFALAGGAVWAWNESNGTWSNTNVPGTADKVRDDFGTLLAVSPFGLYRWDGAGWVTVTAAWGSGSGVEFTEFAGDPDGTLWETHAQALLEQTGATWVTRKPPGPVDNNIQNVLWDGSRLWMLTYDGGVSRFDGTTWRGFSSGCCGTGQDTSFMDPAFAFMAQLDHSGRIWTSHWERGIERIDPSSDPMHVDHLLVTVGLPTSDSLCRHSDGWSSAVDAYGYVFVGGDTPDRGTLEPMGIDVYSPAGARLINWKTTNAGLRSNQVRTIVIDKYRQLWAGFAQAGLAWAWLDSTSSDRSLLPSANDHLRLPAFQALGAVGNADIFGMVAHGESLWVLTTSDLLRLRAATRALSATYTIPAGPAPRGAVHPLDVAPDGTVWVGSVDGVRRYPPGGGSEDFKVDNSPLADNEVRAVYVEPATGAVWIGTASGLNRYDPHWQPPPAPKIATLRLKAWPNPATLNGLGLSLRVSSNAATLHGEVLDLGGRVVRRFPETASGGVVWDGRDGHGTLVQPGVYFVHAHGGGHESMTRVVVLR